MNMRGLAFSAGLGAAIGAVAILMMPHNNPTRRIAEKAADKMEDAATQMGETITRNLDRM